jgi:hypothetical protein
MTDGTSAGIPERLACVIFPFFFRGGGVIKFDISLNPNVGQFFFLNRDGGTPLARMQLTSKVGQCVSIGVSAR